MKPTIVAEIGTGHRGDINHAFELIHAAKESGADVAKFQIVIADEILHPNTGEVALPGGSIDLYQEFKKLEQNENFYFLIAEKCRKTGIQFQASPFGLKSAEILKKISPDSIKIASPEINHFPLLESVKDYPLILSSGVSKLVDIEKALDIVGTENNILLHCITQYPAPEEEYNVRLIASLRTVFGIKTGISDHSMDPVLVPLLAQSQGAVLIEKHFTMSRQHDGLDDPIAIEPDDFKRMTSLLKECEESSRNEIIEKLSSEYDIKQIKRCLGDGVKRLAPSEAANYNTTNRSLHIMNDTQAGSILSADNIGILRSEKNLAPGLPPEYLPLITGKTLVRDLSAGQGILWDDLLS